MLQPAGGGRDCVQRGHGIGGFSVVLCHLSTVCVSVCVREGLCFL